MRKILKDKRDKKEKMKKNKKNERYETNCRNIKFYIYNIIAGSLIYEVSIWVLV